MSDLRRMAAEGRLEVGTTVRISRTFSESEVQAFGELTHDFNPVHYEAKWAAGKGFARPVCHGLLVGSMICEPGGQWGWLASGMSFRFRAPVYPGDTVTCEITIAEIDENRRARAECTFTNQRGEIVLTGELWGHLPSADERQILGELIQSQSVTASQAPRYCGAPPDQKDG